MASQMAAVTPCSQMLISSRQCPRSLATQCTAQLRRPRSALAGLQPRTPAATATTHSRCGAWQASRVVCRASEQEEPAQQPTSSQVQPPAESSDGSLAYNAVLWLLYAGLMAYVFLLSPNQTPMRDLSIVKILANLAPADETYQVNQIFASVFNIMAIYPAIFTSLLIPAARTDKVPAWPFCAMSFLLGAYALIPYMILWQPKQQPEQLPPPPGELEGWNRLFLKGAETPIMPAFLLAASTYLIFKALNGADASVWLDYVKLFDESRAVHATSLDFALCTVLLPFWMSNDAEGRNWRPRGVLVPVLSCLPVVGPSLYLLLRPKASAAASKDA